MRTKSDPTETNVIDLLIQFGGHYQDRRGRRGRRSGCLGHYSGCTARADEAKVKDGADEPQEAACDVARPRPDENARYACMALRSLKQQPRHDFAIANLE
jgi:hypothetical protein